MQLTTELFDYSERLRPAGSRIPSNKRLSDLVRQAEAIDYGHIARLDSKAKNCVIYVQAKRVMAYKVTKRKALSELSINIIKTTDNGVRKRFTQYPKGYYGCELYKIYVCRGGDCWKEHIHAIST